MFSIGGSSKKTKHEDNSVNLQNGGTVLTEGSTQNVTNVSTDSGAVRDAFDFGEDSVIEMRRTAENANKSMAQVARDGFDFGEDALYQVSKNSTNAVDKVAALGQKLVDFGERSLDAMSDGQTKAMSAINANNSASMGAIKGMAENINAGVTSETTGTEKTIALAVGGLVLMFFFMMIMFAVRGAK